MRYESFKILDFVYKLKHNGVMEFISRNEIKVLSNPGVQSLQLLNPKNSTSKRVTLTRVSVTPGFEQPRHKHEASLLLS